MGREEEEGANPRTQAGGAGNGWRPGKNCAEDRTDNEANKVRKGARVQRVQLNARGRCARRVAIRLSFNGSFLSLFLSLSFLSLSLSFSLSLSLSLSLSSSFPASLFPLLTFIHFIHLSFIHSFVLHLLSTSFIRSSTFALSSSSC